MKTRWVRWIGVCALLFSLIIGLSATTVSADPPPIILGSVASDGTQGNGDSMMNEPGSPSASADGNILVFESKAANLVPGDTNGATDIFVHNFLTGTTIRVSVASDGTQANGPSINASISANGQFVVFQSDATNLIPNDTNGQSDIFWHNLASGQTLRVSMTVSGLQTTGESSYPSISRDGRYVSYCSKTLKTIHGNTYFYDDIYLHDVQTLSTVLISVSSSGEGAGQVARAGIMV
ncbi:MAG: hypothetical protein HGB14_06270, partial [Anaerolineaceae bacterium]|nr:hypothetical protein [Anaerolineaceae bacterium]